ncbi:MAG: hypothetical protein ACRDI3_08030 [Actinomycetota bacterium]
MVPTRVRAGGYRGTLAFEIQAVLDPLGGMNGRVDLASPFFEAKFKIDCGWTDGSIAVLGGHDANAVAWVVMVSDNPDGLIVGNGRDCDTTGFGNPSSLAITSGDISIVEH